MEDAVPALPKGSSVQSSPQTRAVLDFSCSLAVEYWRDPVHHFMPQVILLETVAEFGSSQGCHSRSAPGQRLLSRAAGCGLCQC